MGAALAAKRLISPMAYLTAEAESPIRHEFVDGLVYAMSGGSQDHSLLAFEAGYLLRSQIPARCRVFNSDMRLKVSLNDSTYFYYPDLMVVCGGRNPDVNNIETPDLVLEVLSESTERIDRGEKFAVYRSIPSLAVYVLVAQDRRQVEVFRRATGWEAELFETGKVPLPEVGADLDLDLLYARTGAGTAPESPGQG